MSGSASKWILVGAGTIAAALSACEAGSRTIVRASKKAPAQAGQAAKTAASPSTHLSLIPAEAAAEISGDYHGTFTIQYIDGTKIAQAFDLSVAADTGDLGLSSEGGNGAIHFHGDLALDSISTAYPDLVYYNLATRPRKIPVLSQGKSAASLRLRFALVDGSKLDPAQSEISIEDCGTSQGCNGPIPDVAITAFGRR